MKRRTFIKYSAVTTTTMMFPQLAEANWLKDSKKVIKVAFWASKLNPVRLFAGLVFNKVAEVYVEPMAKEVFDNFLERRTVHRSQIASYAPSSSKIIGSMREVEYEPYKASVIVYSKSNYEIERENRVRLELIASMDKERFAQIRQYYKDEKIQVKLYDGDIISTVGDDFTPTELLNIDYVKYGNISKEKHIEELLKGTNNTAFKDIIV